MIILTPFLRDRYQRPQDLHAVLVREAVDDKGQLGMASAMANEMLPPEKAPVVAIEDMFQTISSGTPDSLHSQVISSG
jgi:hypothetical protein